MIMTMKDSFQSEKYRQDKKKVIFLYAEILYCLGGWREFSWGEKEERKQKVLWVSISHNSQQASYLSFTFTPSQYAP